MKRSCSLASILFLAIPLFSQEGYFLFRGELHNAKSGEVIPWASVYIKGTSLGVASNERGQFEFSIAKKYLKDSIFISALGYKSVGFVVEDLGGKAYYDLKLEERTYLLKELTVSSPDPKAIVNKAFDYWDRNFCVSKYEFDSFYRQTQNENGKFARLWECSLRGLDHGYNNAKRGSVNIEYLQIRKSNDYRDSRTRWLIGFFKPQFIFTIENFSRNKDLLMKNFQSGKYTYELDSILYLDNKMVYVVDARADDKVKEFLFDARLYIREEDNVFVQMDFNGNRKIDFAKPTGIPGKLKLKFTDYRSTFVFKEVDGKMFMYYLNVKGSFNWTDQAGNKIYQEENSEAIIQNIHILDKKEKSKIKSNFSNLNYGIPHGSYTSEYWRSYELVKQIPYAQGITKDLQKDSSLEEQFIKNGSK
jgi:CarboxypepD_reg-like domain